LASLNSQVTPKASSLVYRFIAALAVPNLGTILKHAKADSCRLFARGADQSHIRDVDWRLALDSTHLRPYVARPALVLDDQIDALDHDPVFTPISTYFATMAVNRVASNHTVHRSL
jgi:hypothetical protein